MTTFNDLPKEVKDKIFAIKKLEETIDINKYIFDKFIIDRFIKPVGYFIINKLDEKTEKYIKVSDILFKNISDINEDIKKDEYLYSIKYSDFLIYKEIVPANNFSLSISNK